MGRQPRPPHTHLIALNFTVGRNSRLAGGGNEYHRVLTRTSHHPVLPVQKADSRGAGFLSASLCLCAHPIHLPFERTLLSSFYLEAALSCQLDYLEAGGREFNSTVSERFAKILTERSFSAHSVKN